MNWMQAVMDAKKAGAVYPGDQQQKGTTMSEKYIDLAVAIWDELEPTMAGTAYITRALEWLDDHPDQVPGRTITESEYRDTLNGAVKTSGYGDDWERGFCAGLNVGGTRVVLDPEPTNSQQMFADLEELTGDGFLLRDRHLEKIAKHLTDLGWTKAPGANDEH